jgi:hypothetical protein
MPGAAAGKTSDGAGTSDSAGASAPTFGAASGTGGGTSISPGDPGGSAAGASSVPITTPTSDPTAPTPGLVGPPSSGETIEPSPVGTTTPPPAMSGLLTAGTWDDNRNFDRFMSFRDDAFQQQIPGLLPITVSEQKASLSEFGTLPSKKKTLDISFVIDTTGSMGDELAYLQAEFISISDAVHAKYPNAAQRWSLVVYRDTVDIYLTRWFDFRTDAQDFQTNLAAQAADGGGDFPESPERGIAKMNELAWRSDADTARLAFWVADAPHHPENAGALADALRDSHDLGIHIYPVAASGVDDLTELTMRTAAQLTGGRYLFLTNDSGVGGDHKEPRIPCYFVTHLDDALLRMVDIEMSGEYREPSASQIVRTGGDPKDGACTLDSGEQVVVF